MWGECKNRKMGSFASVSARRCHYDCGDRVTKKFPGCSYCSVMKMRKRHAFSCIFFFFIGNFDLVKKYFDLYLFLIQPWFCQTFRNLKLKCLLVRLFTLKKIDKYFFLNLESVLEWKLSAQLGTQENIK